MALPIPWSTPDTFEFENPKKASGSNLSGLLLKSQVPFRILARCQLPQKQIFVGTRPPQEPQKIYLIYHQRVFLDFRSLAHVWRKGSPL